MKDDDIDGWIDQLAGKPGRDATPEEQAEIARLRAALVAHAANEADARPRPPPNDLADERAWQKLTSQMNFDAQASPGRVKRLAWPALATAAVLMIAVSVTWRNFAGRDDDIAVAQGPAPQYHGTVPVIEVDDAVPLARAKHLAKRLTPMATQPKVYFSGGRATVEIEIQDARLAEVIKEVATEGIPTAGLVAGIAQITFVAR